MNPSPEPLPHAPIGMVLGLLDHLRDAPNGREDLYKLGRTPGLRARRPSPRHERREATRARPRGSSGDIELTDEGRALAAAEEPERKRRVGRRVLGLDLVGDIRRAIESSESGRAAKKQFLDRLEQLFSPQEAERQL